MERYVPTFKWEFGSKGPETSISTVIMSRGQTESSPIKIFRMITTHLMGFPLARLTIRLGDKYGETVAAVEAAGTMIRNALRAKDEFRPSSGELGYIAPFNDGEVFSQAGIRMPRQALRALGLPAKVTEEAISQIQIEHEVQVLVSHNWIPHKSFRAGQHGLGPIVPARAV